MQLIGGAGQPTAGQHYMTPEEFAGHIAWPGDMPFCLGGEAAEEGDIDAGEDSSNEDGNDGEDNAEFIREE